MVSDKKMMKNKAPNDFVEPVPADKLELLDVKKKATAKVITSTSEAKERMRKIMEEEGAFAFCVRADTGHTIVGYTDDGHDVLFASNDVPSAEKKFWSVGGVMDGANVEYSNLGVIPGVTPKEVFQKSNAALLSAGLDTNLGFSTPKMIADEDRQKGELTVREMTPGGKAIPHSNAANIECVWEDGYAYTGWVIEGLGAHGREGTRLNHDRLTSKLGNIGDYEVFSSSERGSAGDKGEFLPASYQNICDNRTGEPLNKVSAGGTWTTGYMITRAKAKQGHIPSTYNTIQKVFKRDNVNSGD